LKNLNLIPGIQGIDHIGIAVNSLENSIKFYEEVLGASLVHTEVNEEQNISEAMLNLHGQIIQLLAPLSKQGAIHEFLIKHGEGVQQLALKVANLDDACIAARNNGITVIFPQHKRGTSNSRINFLHPKDCGGVLLELVERAD
jgi:methylmalonyl-CoA/ethylmalonyl-CoA epimerase